ncbi:hypothetical protein N510_001195 [Firmicutes bacterium ASF500]|nr:hypothetical protein N510_001195 [Firmicutes bacterium ASF500]
MKYYPIDEALARRAKTMISFSDYVEGSATAEYRRAVDEAARLAEQQKRKVDPIHHDRIDQLLDTYSRRLAENINQSNAITARVPSILIAGGSNFPVHKKEKQNQAANTNLAEWRQIQGLLDKIRGTGRGGISADDPEAVRKLKLKLAGLERDQEKMKAVNAHYRKHKTLDGCPQLAPDEAEKIQASMARDWRKDPKPYPSFHLTNNNAMIRQTKKRIEELSTKAETEYEGWAFEGGEVQMNRESNRLRVFFHEKPDRDTCSAMRHSGFKWAPSVGAWQRQLTDNAIYAAKHLDCLRPLSGERPAPEQAGSVQEPAQDAVVGWVFYIIADLKTWADNAAERSELEHFPSFEAAKARFDELRGEPYNSEAVEPGPDGQPPARLTLGIESADGMSAVDILHVRQGENYLVTDFTRSERLRDDPMVMDILSRVSREIGFERVRVWEQADGGRQLLSVVPFAEWDNPWFPSATPGRIAAQYCTLLHECYPLPTDDEIHSGQIAEIVKSLQKEGKRGADQMALAVAGFGATFSDNAAVQKQAEALMKELARYDAPGLDEARQRRLKHKKSPER